jgi:hypothetical protein
MPHILPVHPTAHNTLLWLASPCLLQKSLRALKLIRQQLVPLITAFKSPILDRQQDARSNGFGSHLNMLRWDRRMIDLGEPGASPGSILYGVGGNFVDSKRFA